VCNDLREGIAMLMSGELDAQENPFANYVAYGVHKVHPYVSLTGHIYGARGVYASAVQLRGWPEEARGALAAAARAAIAQQRNAAVRKEAELREWLTRQGVQITELTDDELAAFQNVAQPILADAREQFDPALWSLLEGRC
jgi:TRAP-type transport system periplasmic protein